MNYSRCYRFCFKKTIGFQIYDFQENRMYFIRNFAKHTSLEYMNHQQGKYFAIAKGISKLNVCFNISFPAKNPCKGHWYRSV